MQHYAYIQAFSILDSHMQKALSDIYFAFWLNNETLILGRLVHLIV